MRARRTAIAGLALLLGAACQPRRDVPEPTSPATSSAAPTLPGWLAEAELVFVGEVLELGPPAPFRTGFPGLARQRVDYRVVETLRGEAPARLSVAHAILTGPTAAADGVSLDPALFRAGARLLVAARSGGAGEPRWVEDAEQAAPVEQGLAKLHGGDALALAELRAALE